MASLPRSLRTSVRVSLAGALLALLVAASHPSPAAAAAPAPQRVSGDVPQDELSAWKWRLFQNRLTGEPLPASPLPTRVVESESGSPFGVSGNAAAGDAAWSEIPPPALWLHSSIYDPLRDRILVFGGKSSRGPSCEVWQLNLSGSPRWQRLAIQGSGPAARSMHTAVYDPVGDRMIVFGGYDDATYHNDVWALSLAGEPAWTQITAGGGPSARGWHAAVCDPPRNRMVVFGGTNGATRMSDVWALSLGGTPSWTQLSPAGAGPGPRSTLPAVYDAPGDRIVFYGGIDATGSTRTDVWALTLGGTPSWSQIVPAGTAPTARNGASAIFDPVRRQMVLFAGGTGAPNTNETWALSLSGPATWTQLGPTNPPQGRQFHTAIYDPIGDRMLVFGGSSGLILSGTWALSLSASEAWIPLSGTRRRGHVAIYDGQRQRMVVVGGDDGAALNDVWELDLGDSPSWLRLNPAGTLPGPRAYHAGVYDPVRDRVLVFGGRGTSPQNDVWELSFSGAVAWRQIFPEGTAPPARIDHDAVYDPLRHRMIVFGGAAAGGSVFNDVWALSLSGSPTWAQLIPTGTAPGARGAAAAVYDPDGDRVLVFGGYDKNLVCYADCWALSLAGTPAWTRLYPSGSTPDARLAPAAAYDSQRGRVLLFGGTDLITYFSDTWELSLTGTPAWTQLAPSGVAPLQRSDHKAIYDPVADRMVLFGGGAMGGGFLNDTWGLQFVPVVDAIAALPARSRVWPAAPNPTPGPARFEFESSAAADARIAVFDVRGRLVREVASGRFVAGRHAAAWDGTDARGERVPTGVYFYRVTLGADHQDGKLVVVR